MRRLACEEQRMRRQRSLRATLTDYYSIGLPKCCRVTARCRRRRPGRLLLISRHYPGLFIIIKFSCFIFSSFLQRLVWTFLPWWETSDWYWEEIKFGLSFLEVYLSFSEERRCLCAISNFFFHGSIFFKAQSGQQIEPRLTNVETY